MIVKTGLMKDEPLVRTLAGGRYRVNHPERLDEATNTVIASQDVVAADDAAAAARNFIGRLIDRHDKGKTVNSAMLVSKGVDYEIWLPVSKRNELARSVQLWQKVGNEDYTLDLREHGVSLNVPCDALLHALEELECYAVKCYNATSLHMINIQMMEDAEEILRYDFTKGYPERPIMNL